MNTETDKPKYFYLSPIMLWKLLLQFKPSKTFSQILSNLSDPDQTFGAVKPMNIKSAKR